MASWICLAGQPPTVVPPCSKTSISRIVRVSWILTRLSHSTAIFRVSGAFLKKLRGKSAAEIDALLTKECCVTAKSRTKWGPEHGKGNVGHNNPIEDVLDAAQSRGATDLRKNRVQRDAIGNRVYSSDGSYAKPDASWVEGGVRHNHNRVSYLDDIDRELDAYFKMIEADPKAVNSLDF